MVTADLYIQQLQVTADLNIQQLQSVHQSLLKRRPALVNWKNVLLYDNARPHTARITQEKIWSLAGLFYLTHHTHLTLRLSSLKTL